MSDHATFPPSSNHRLIACPASHRETQNLPVQPPSIYAEHGTLLHDYCYKGYDFVESLKPGEDKNWCLDALEYVQGVIIGSGVTNPQIQLEERVSLTSWLLPEVWGTLDVGLVTPDTIHIMDYKFGKTPVEAYKNPQLLTYAAGMAGYPPMRDNIVLHVIQPPLNSYPTYKCDAQELTEFIFHELSPAIKSAKSAAPEFGPSEEACRFCRAAMTCKARYQNVMEAASQVFDIYKAIPNRVKQEDIALAMKLMPKVERYFKDLRIWVQVEKEKGKLHSVPWKVVYSGKGRRNWVKEQEVMEWLDNYTELDEDDYTKTTLLSPAQVEKLDRSLKKNEAYHKLYKKGKGNKILVKETDKREAIEPEKDAASAFKEVINE